MAKKYYAVKIGKVPGIYTTWSECKEQVFGYPSAIYKSFLTYQDAQNFLGNYTTTGNSASVKNGFNENKSEAVAYVDGSYNSATEEFSYGVVIFYSDKEVQFSKKFTNSNIRDMRNVAGEINGARKAMQFCIENNIKSVDIYYDYQGIECWCTGAWKTNKQGTIEYKKYYDSIKDKLSVNFKKVKGHSGDKYNDLADSLAKNAFLK